MALSEGTGYSYTPPKPPKPQVSYGAPSGPYADHGYTPPTASPAAVQVAHLQQTLQHPMQQPSRALGTTELARRGAPFAAGYNTRSWQREVGRMKHYENPWEQRFAGGFWGTFDPRNYTPQKLRSEERRVG